MIENLDSAINYAGLVGEIDASFVMKPLIENYEEFKEEELREKELNSYGFYLSKHPTSKYQDASIIKLENIKQYFDKQIRCVILIDKIKTIKTKKGETMAFITGSDETGNAEFILFPKVYTTIYDMKKNDIFVLNGKVTKRFDSYQIIVYNLQKVVGDNNA